MRTDRALTIFPYWGVSHFSENGNILKMRTPPPLRKMGDPPGQTPPLPLPPIVDRMTDACENIIFPHTTYAVGNYVEVSK